MSAGLATSLVAAEWAFVLANPHARCLRRKERALASAMRAPGLGRDAVAALQVQVARINAQISESLK